MKFFKCKQNINKFKEFFRYFSHSLYYYFNFKISQAELKNITIYKVIISLLGTDWDLPNFPIGNASLEPSRVQIYTLGFPK